MTIDTHNGTILVTANTWQSALLEVMKETEKAIQVKNVENGKVCWLPKAALKKYKPGVETYENNYDIANWFFPKMSSQQERVLNILE